MLKLWEAENAATVEDLVKRLYSLRAQGIETFGRTGDPEYSPTALLAREKLECVVLYMPETACQKYGLYRYGHWRCDLIHALTNIGNELENFVDNDIPTGLVSVDTLIAKLEEIINRGP